jgi:hypothetical protein
MRWVIGGAAVLILVALVVTQLVLPPVASNQLEDRLTKDGGTADASVRAFPALRLLFDDGDKLSAHARGILIRVADLTGGSLKKLDGFDEVDIELRKSHIGPFTTDAMDLRRPEGEKLYDFRFRGSTTGRQLSDFALAALPPTLAGIIAGLVERTTRIAGAIPVDIAAQLKSEGGTARMVSGRGTVAGLPLSGLALSIAGAVVSRLTG